MLLLSIFYLIFAVSVVSKEHSTSSSPPQHPTTTSKPKKNESETSSSVGPNPKTSSTTQSPKNFLQPPQSPLSITQALERLNASIQALKNTSHTQNLTSTTKEAPTKKTPENPTTAVTTMPCPTSSTGSNSGVTTAAGATVDPYAVVYNAGLDDYNTDGGGYTFSFGKRKKRADYHIDYDATVPYDGPYGGYDDPATTRQTSSKSTDKAVVRECTTSLTTTICPTAYAGYTTMSYGTDPYSINYDYLVEKRKKRADYHIGYDAKVPYDGSYGGYGAPGSEPGSSGGSGCSADYGAVTSDPSEVGTAPVDGNGAGGPGDSAGSSGDSVDSSGNGKFLYERGYVA